MSTDPARPPGGQPLVPAQARPPAPFADEIRTAVRYERGLALKALAVLAVLGVVLLLRALYLT